MSCTPHIFTKKQSRITNFRNQSYFVMVLGCFFAKIISFENSELVLVKACGEQFWTYDNTDC